MFFFNAQSYISLWYQKYKLKKEIAHIQQVISDSEDFLKAQGLRLEFAKEELKLFRSDEVTGHFSGYASQSDFNSRKEIVMFQIESLTQFFAERDREADLQAIRNKLAQKNQELAMLGLGTPHDSPQDENAPSSTVEFDRASL